STSSASVKLNEDGSVNVLTSAVEMGQGLKTAMALITSEKLGIPVHRVQVSDVDTDVTPYDQQTSSSRSTYAMGKAVSMAVDDVCRQALDLGATLLESSVEDLEVIDGAVRARGAPDYSIGLGELVRRTRSGNLLGHGVFRTRGG